LPGRRRMKAGDIVLVPKHTIYEQPQK